MRQRRLAGEKLFIDSAGKTVALEDCATGHVCVAAMRASSYTFACATGAQRLGEWIAQGHSVLLIGSTGVGKSWIASALGQYACRRGHSVRYLRVPRLPEELRLLHGNGALGKWLYALAKIDVLILDDWRLASIDTQTRADLLAPAPQCNARVLARP